jgi:PAS domain S-box-containing protein
MKNRATSERLHGFLNDLESLMALPFLRAGGEPAQVVSILLETLVGMLGLAFAFVRLDDPDGGLSIKTARVTEALERSICAREIGEALEMSFADVPLKWPPRRRLSIGDMEFSISSTGLGLQGEFGVVIAGAQKVDFPGQTESFLLDVAASRAAMALQRARLLGPPNQGATEVAERESHLDLKIDQRKRAEDTVPASRHNLRLLIDTIPALAWSARTDGSAEFFNQYYLDYVGLSAEEAKNWGWTVAVHPDDLNALAATWQRIVASEEAGEAEARLRGHDGEFRWFLLRVNPLRDGKGNIVRWCGVNTDIDDRRRVETELTQAHLYLTEAQRLSKTGSFVADLAADVHIWSEESFRICEIDPATKLTVQMFRDLVHPDDQTSFDAVIARAMTGTDVDFVFRIVTPRGTAKYLRGIARVIEQGTRRPLFSGAIQDVTESKIAEEALQKARSELAHVARVATLGELTASIAHEINQPLSGIITNASTCLRMLSADPPNIDGARETTRRTIRDGNRTADVITRLRAMFTKKEFTQAPLDLNEAVREVIALSQSDLQRNRVNLRSELADDLPIVNGDRVQLQQVILNLVRNASDAMVAVDDRRRKLLIRTERDEADCVRVTVRDSGVGVDPHHIGKLFDPFYTSKSGGMGIGLSVSRSIIERHHGRIGMEPNDGEGATFWFSIPRGPESIAAAPAVLT